MIAKKYRRRKTTPRKTLLEVVDIDNRVVGLMPKEEVHEQQLMHRSVLVLLYNTEKKLYIQKRSSRKLQYPGCWDLSANGHVLAFETPKEAAIRELQEELGIAVSNVNLVHNIPACTETEFEFVSLFSAGVSHQVPQPNPRDVIRGVFVEGHELDYLVRTFADQFTPGVHYFWSCGLLFQ
ncbi:MAG: NUDIX domain-containing protein [Desulfohalobiaceae bacterium]|nr:NUDIX domain-containing protein [Desulfohalobiaceae bacterium]